MGFHRPTLAEDIASPLLLPKGLMKKVRSGLFLGGMRRIGKTTFIRGDLIPALEARGAIVVYVDLWSNMAAKPKRLRARSTSAATGGEKSHFVPVSPAVATATVFKSRPNWPDRGCRRNSKDRQLDHGVPYLARDGQGICGVSDPFVAEAIANRANVLKLLDGPEAQP